MPELTRPTLWKEPNEWEYRARGSWEKKGGGKEKKKFDPFLPILFGDLCPPPRGTQHGRSIHRVLRPPARNGRARELDSSRAREYKGKVNAWGGVVINWTRRVMALRPASLKRAYNIPGFEAPHQSKCRTTRTLSCPVHPAVPELCFSRS